jgi:DNA helicase TIP49 (TBP-interacting protein)
VTEEERIAMPVGEYQLEDGSVLIVEEEGIIASIGAAEEAPEEEVSEEVEASEEVTEENLEEEKEEMGYATKEELAEVKSMIEDIKAMIEKKEEMSEEVSEELQEEVKEELSAVEKVTHNPEIEENKMNFLYGQSRTQNTMDRVMAKISQIKK